MKKALRILSVITCAFCAFCFVMFNIPKIINNDDSIGFLLILIGIILSVVMPVLWVLFCIFKQKDNAKLKTTSIVLLVIHIALLVNIFTGLVPLSNVTVTLQWLVPIISNVLFIVFSK